MSASTYKSHQVVGILLWGLVMVACALAIHFVLTFVGFYAKDPGEKYSWRYNPYRKRKVKATGLEITSLVAAVVAALIFPQSTASIFFAIAGVIAVVGLMARMVQYAEET